MSCISSPGENAEPHLVSCNSVQHTCFGLTPVPVTSLPGAPEAIGVPDVETLRAARDGPGVDVDGEAGGEGPAAQRPDLCEQVPEEAAHQRAVSHAGRAPAPPSGPLPASGPGAWPAPGTLTTDIGEPGTRRAFCCQGASWQHLIQPCMAGTVYNPCSLYLPP